MVKKCQNKSLYYCYSPYDCTVYFYYYTFAHADDTWWVSLELSNGSDSLIKWNSSGVKFWTQLAVTAKALLWAVILKKSRNIRQADIPLCKNHHPVSWYNIYKEYKSTYENTNQCPMLPEFHRNISIHWTTELSLNHL